MELLYRPRILKPAEKKVPVVVILDLRLRKLFILAVHNFRVNLSEFLII